MRQRRNPASRLLVAAVAAAAWIGGCRLDMHDQPKIQPYEGSAFFADGRGARPLPAGTVARGKLRADTWFYTGKTATGDTVAIFPAPVTRADLERGRERYDIYCSPCHDRTGKGDGMIIQRGFPRPASFHDDRLRGAMAGHFFNAMTNGFGVMPSYAVAIPPADRWAIVAYIRALQLSQNAKIADVPDDARQVLEKPLAATTTGGAAARGDGHD